jgi:hypothetical protein
MHPEIVSHLFALLCSINERLGAMLAEGQEAGEDLLPPGEEWIRDVFEIKRREIARQKGFAYHG